MEYLQKREEREKEYNHQGNPRNSMINIKLDLVQEVRRMEITFSCIKKGYSPNLNLVQRTMQVETEGELDWEDHHSVQSLHASETKEKSMARAQEGTTPEEQTTDTGRRKSTGLQAQTQKFGSCLWKK